MMGRFHKSFTANVNLILSGLMDGLGRGALRNVRLNSNNLRATFKHVGGSVYLPFWAVIQHSCYCQFGFSENIMNKDRYLKLLKKNLT